jgi:mRNA interferase MazF
MNDTLLRGRVYMIDLGERVGRKPFLVVTNTARNRAFGEALAVRITTTAKPRLPSIVELAQPDAPLVGRVLCDAFAVIYPDEVLEDRGALSPGTMRQVEVGLQAALGIR